MTNYLLTLLLIFLLSWSPVFGQATTEASKEQTIELYDYLQTFAESSKTILLMEEGIDNQLLDSATLPSGQLSKKEFLSLLDSLNLSMSRAEGITILQRDFKTELDLPRLSQAESLHFLKNTQRIFIPFADHKDWSRAPRPNPVMQEFIYSLNEEQTAALKAGTLSFAHLNEQQQSLIYRFTVYFYIDSRIAEARGIGRLIQAMPEMKVGYGFIYNKTLFGFEVSSPAEGRYFRSWEGMEDGAYPRSEKAKQQIQKRLPTNVRTITLKEFADRFTKSTRIAFEVDEILAEKEITLFGNEATITQSSQKIVKAIARHYNLRLVREEKKWTLRPRTAKTPERIERATASIREVIPLPLTRSLFQHPFEAFSIPEHIRIMFKSPELMLPMTRQRYKASVQILWESIDQHLAELQRRKDLTPEENKALQERQIPYSLLTKHEQDLFRMTFLLEFFRGDNKAFGPPPSYITHLPDCTFRGGEFLNKKGGKYIELSLLEPNKKTASLQVLANVR